MLGIVLLWIVVYLSGMLFCKIAGEKETSQLWKHLIGFFFLIFFQGIVFGGGQLLNWTFQRTAMTLTVLLLVICGISVLLCKEDILEMSKTVNGDFEKGDCALARQGCAHHYFELSNLPCLTWFFAVSSCSVQLCLMLPLRLAFPSNSEQDSGKV